MTAIALDGTDPHRRLAAISGIELLKRSKFGDTGPLLTEQLLDVAMSGLRPTAQPPLSKVFAVYSARLVAALGHEEFFGAVGYDNSERAETRSAWAQEFPSLKFGHQTTSSECAVAITGMYRNFNHRVLEQSENYRLHDSYIKLLEASRELFEENELAQIDEALPVFADVLTSRAPRASIDARELREIGERAIFLAREIAQSGSLILQESLVPALYDANELIASSLANASRISHPALDAEVITPRLPLRSRTSGPFKVRWQVRNIGNSAAKALHARVKSADLAFDVSAIRVAELMPAAEVEIAFTATAENNPSTANLSLAVSWVDDLGQDFQEEWTAVVEDQVQSNWTRADANPFSLSTIGDQSRLVGRTQELAALEGVLRMSDSAYVTGLKRVGKSSLVRTLLSSLEREPGWAITRLELGTMLGGSGQPSAVALGILDGIGEALTDLDLEVEPLELRDPSRDEYARLAGRWLRKVDRLVRDAPDFHLVVAIDDFDGLPLEFVEGEQGQAFFLFLRSLVDRPWLGLIFIGSEVMPTIIAAQSHQLNQVRRTGVDHFQSSSDTSLLLRNPAEKQLDWSESSVEKVHRYASGNPYYATMIAQRIWDVLRALDRTQVEVHDVVDAVDYIAATADSAHFGHMWSDDPAGMAPKGRPAMLSAALLLAIARCAGPFERASKDEILVVAQQIASEVAVDELQTLLRRLISRGIVVGDDIESNYSLRVPLLSEWLRHRGRQELGAAFEAFSKDRSQKRLITSRDLVDIADGLNYAGQATSEHRLHAWLDQFGDDVRDRHLAFLLLQRMRREGYFNGDRIYRSALPRLRDAIVSAVPEIHVGKQKYLQNVYILEHGKSGSSAPSVVTQLRQIAHVKKENCLSGSEIALRVQGSDKSVIWVVDDFAGTGGQLATVVDGLVEELDRLGDWKERVVLVIGAAIAAGTGQWTSLRFGGADLRVAAGIRVTNRLRAFDPEARIFENDDDRLRAQEVMTVIGKQLAPRAPLGWSDDGLLVLLEGNCPNNTLPVFHKAGRYAGSDWLPLFPRAV